MAGYHEGRERADRRRDRQLARLGWRVVRVEARDVLERREEVVARIAAALVG